MVGILYRIIPWKTWSCQKIATESSCHRSALHGYLYSSCSEKNGGVFVTLVLCDLRKLSTSVKEWADSIPASTMFYCQQTYLISSNCGSFFFFKLMYIFFFIFKKSSVLFIVFIEPLDSIFTNALAKSLQIFWQALLAGDKHTGFAIGRVVAWLLLILGPGKW